MCAENVDPGFKYFVGSKEESDKDRLRLRIKNYLELSNVNILAGAGTSFHLGCPIIRTIPKEINDALIKNEDLKEIYADTIKSISKDDKGFESIPLEDFLNYLQAERFIEEKRGKDIEQHNKLIGEIQKQLFLLCNTQYTEIHKEYIEDDKLKQNKYHYHEKLVKKLLQRSVDLRRINLFTTNYDLSFEYAFDNVGIYYINGFSGFQRRCFRPETYDYDIYYPGQTTSGKVHRAEKVIRYYKLHGSLSWIYKEPDAGNLYGIEEVVIDNDKPENELVIYPCATKKAFTLDLPYSELFRLFSCAIKQSQSVLFCLGYSFNDEHINNIIYQALSIPSFTLFIIDYKSTENSEIEKLRTLDDPRIIIIGGELAKFTKFASGILPDLYEEKDDIKVTKTIKELIGAVNKANPDENSKPEDSDV